MIMKAVKDRFQKEIGNIVEELKIYKPKKVILFGSFATGDVHAGSDIDLCVIKNTNERFMDRTYQVLRLINSSFAVEPLVYTEDEFKRMKEEANPLIARIVNEGKVLYEQKS